MLCVVADLAGRTSGPSLCLARFGARSLLVPIGSYWLALCLPRCSPVAVGLEGDPTFVVLWPRAGCGPHGRFFWPFLSGHPGSHCKPTYMAVQITRMRFSGTGTESSTGSFLSAGWMNLYPNAET
jgi:hypothetical protein